MQTGKFNCILDAFWGSSGKGKVSTWLADHFNVTHVSSANFPNAGHTAAFESGTKFISKAIPTAAILKREKGIGMNCYLAPGSGFSWEQVTKEWKESGKPNIFVHERASIVTEDHKRREREGAESTLHIASTMQGSATAIADKILRRPDCKLAWNTHEEMMRSFEGSFGEEFTSHVAVVRADEFRRETHDIIKSGKSWLHEGSQGYALSTDHGSHYPQCTSRNCTIQAAMDYMAVPPQMVGDVYLNLRTFPIRVGNVSDENGKQLGYSGDFYPDCTEMTWEQVAQQAGMPDDEARALAERERTTVTKRIRRVSTFSFQGLADAVRVNGATKLAMNFIQYIDWNDNKLRDFNKLSKKSRAFLDRVEEVAGVPVGLIGTGPLHEDMIVRL